MNMIGDNELDKLLEESARRETALRNINMNVMRSVKQDVRRKNLRKWMGVIAFCFTIPIMVVLYVYVLNNVQLSLPLLVHIAVYVLPLVTIFLLVSKKLHNITF